MRPCGDKKIRGLRFGRDTLPRGGRNRDGDCGGVDEGEWGFARPLRIHGVGLARPRICGCANIARFFGRLRRMGRTAGALPPHPQQGTFFGAQSSHSPSGRLLVSHRAFGSLFRPLAALTFSVLHFSFQALRSISAFMHRV